MIQTRALSSSSFSSIFGMREDNDTMTVFDLANNKPITSLRMAGGADVIKFDTGLQRVYVACGSGAISIFQQDDPTHYRKLQGLPGREEGPTA
jgi:hypothetical protein